MMGIPLNSPWRSDELSQRSFWRQIAQEIREGDTAAGMTALCSELGSYKAVLDGPGWREFACGPFLDPVRRVLHEDPFTYRARSKPRGYPGDALTLDYIYQLAPCPDGTTDLGRRIFTYAIASHSCRAVRERLWRMTAMVDEVAAVRHGAKVLALACGHLREAQRSHAVMDGLIARYDALDQDPSSLGVVAAERASAAVTPIRASIQDVIAGTVPLGRYDLVYAAGLYDYLPRAGARVLTRAAFDLLERGGRIVVGNFAPDARDIPYLEAIMDWRLVYRDERDLEDLAAALPAGEVARIRTFRDSLEQIVYLEVQRA